MKSRELFEHQPKAKKISWTSDPELGWFMESNPVRIFFGTTERKLASIFENGIYADQSGYIRCALEPHTAYFHSMPLTEKYNTNDKRVVLVIDIPASYSKKHPFYMESQEATDKDLYESWGKSDVEFYALMAEWLTHTLGERDPLGAKVRILVWASSI